MKLFMLAVFTAFVSASFAQSNTLFRVNTKNTKQAVPDSYAQIVNGKIVGDWMPYHDNNSNVNVGPLVSVYDCLNTDPSTIYTTGITNNGYYGTPTSGSGILWWYGNDIGAYTHRVHVNDTKLAPGTQNSFSDFVALAFSWNPNGANGLVLAILTSDAVDQTGFGPAYGNSSGWLFTFNNLSQGFYSAYLKLTGNDRSWPSPNLTGGGYAIIAGGPGFTKLPAGTVFSMGLNSQLSVTSLPAGTNPSDTSFLEWVDDRTAANSYTTNKPDYIVDDKTSSLGAYSELYDFSHGLPMGDIQSAIGFYQDPDARTIEGHVIFEGYNGPRPRPSMITVDVSDGTNTNKSTAILDATGHFKVKDVKQTGAGGARTVHIKAENWLGHTVNTNTTAGDVSGVNISCKNGDVDGDDVVSVFDYIVLSDNFDKDETAANWNNPQNGTGTPPINWADLDRDGVISIFDYIQLSDNFDLSGD